MIDLFGKEIPDTEVKATGPWQKWRKENGYGEATTKEKRCKTCRFAIKTGGGSKGGYWKCQAMGYGSSCHSDIRLKNVCWKWTPIQQVSIGKGADNG